MHYFAVVIIPDLSDPTGHAFEWAPFDGDILPVGEARAQERIPHDLVTRDGWIFKSNWDGENWNETPDWEKLYRETLAKYEGQYAAVVDYHS